MRGEILPRVSVIGLGYIGLPTAAVIARAGMHVHGVDLAAKRLIDVSQLFIALLQIGDCGQMGARLLRQRRRTSGLRAWGRA